jgi:hypothetical protein
MAALFHGPGVLLASAEAFLFTSADGLVSGENKPGFDHRERGNRRSRLNGMTKATQGPRYLIDLGHASPWH